jgi:hypothetical protein
LGTGVAVEKLAHCYFARNCFASGSSTNDFPQSPGHFLSPDLRIFSEKPTFSTATGIITTYLKMRRVTGADVPESLFICHRRINHPPVRGALEIERSFA